MLKQQLIEDGLKYFRSLYIQPVDINPFLQKINSSEVMQSENAAQIMKRNEVRTKDFIELEYFKENPLISQLKKNREAVNQIDIELKYEGYIKRQIDEVEKFNQSEDTFIPDKFDYEKIKSLSAEALEKLKKVKPHSLGQASRIAGVSHSDISILSIYMKG